MFRFAANGVPDADLKPFPIANNQNEAVLLWEVKMAFELVFMTEGTYGDATPLAPRNVQASQGAYSDKVALSWNAVIGATGYEIWRSETNDYADAALLVSPVAGVLTYDDESVTPETVYSYWLKARNASGVSVFSPAVAGHATSSTP